MKRFLSIALFSFLFTMISCKKENSAKPTDESVPNIIVKEKDSNGVFQIVQEMNLFVKNDSSIYFDSVQYIMFSTTESLPTLVFNYSHFNRDKYIYIESTKIFPFDDTFAYAIKFDEFNHITNVGEYAFIENTNRLCANYVSLSSYENGKIGWLGFGDNANCGGCSGAYATVAEYFYYNDLIGNDSLVIITSGSGCGPYNGLHDTIIVNYTNKNNNTNVLHLSYPEIPSITGTASSESSVLNKIENIPFPRLNQKLIESIYYNKNQQPFTPIKFNYSYTFDANNRVKTARIYQISQAKEQLFEFTY